MPVPGKAMAPIGSTSSIWSLRLKGVRPEGDQGHLAVVGPAGGNPFGTFRRTAVQQHHVRMLAANLVERIPDHVVIVEVEPAGECALGIGGEQYLVVRPAFGGEEVATFDRGRGQRAVVDHRSGARPPG